MNQYVMYHLMKITKENRWGIIFHEISWVQLLKIIQSQKFR